MPNAEKDDEYFDRWAKHYSDSVQTNLCPFYEWFGFTLTEDTKKLCESLPGLLLLVDFRIKMEKN